VEANGGPAALEMRRPKWAKTAQDMQDESNSRSGPFLNRTCNNFHGFISFRLSVRGYCKRLRCTMSLKK
jgi:hypothetical protein